MSIFISIELGQSLSEGERFELGGGNKGLVLQADRVFEA